MTSELSKLEIIKSETDTQRSMIEDSLRRRVAQVRHDLDRIVSQLDKDNHLNELGEIQNAGNDIDRLCGMRQALVRQQQMVKFLIAKAEEEEFEK